MRRRSMNGDDLAMCFMGFAITVLLALLFVIAGSFVTAVWHACFP